MRKLAFLCFVLLLMTLPTTARAQVIYDNSAYGNCTTCTSLTYSLTVGSGSNRALAVWVFLSGDGSTFAGLPYVTSITYAGVSLIQIKASSVQNTTSRAELWALPAGTQPTSGANNVVVTLSAAAQDKSMHSGAISVAGVDQTHTFTSLTSSGGEMTPSISITIPYTGANDLVFDAICAGLSVDSTSQTQRFINNVDNSTQCNNSGLSTAAGGTTYVTWNINNAGYDIFQRFGGSFHAAATATTLQLKGGKLQVAATSGTSTPVTSFNWVQAEPYLDQSGASRSTITTSAFPSGTTTGNTIICVSEVGSSSITTTSLTDSQGDTYRKAVGVSYATNSKDKEIWYSSGITGGSNFTVTGNWSSATTAYLFLSCHEYAGLLASGALDATASITQAGGQATSTPVGPATTNYDHELVFYSTGNDVGYPLCGWNDNVRTNTYNSFDCDFVQYTAGEMNAVLWNLFGGNNITALATFRISNAPVQAK